MTYETDSELDSDLQKFGCAFLSLAHFDPTLTDEQINALAEQAHAQGIIDEDDTIQDWQKLVDLFVFPLKNRPGHWSPFTPVNPDTMYLIGEWFNVNTNFTHFVVMDGHGTDKIHVAYDPIQGGSKTVREGAFVSYRIFDKV